MRKFLLAAGLLAGAAFFGGSPAQAAVGCLCGKLGSPAVCTATITDCNFKVGGVCLAPCDYQAPKKAKKAKKAKAKKKM
jgi:hypothetical protein